MIEPVDIADGSGAIEAEGIPDRLFGLRRPALSQNRRGDIAGEDFRAGEDQDRDRPEGEQSETQPPGDEAEHAGASFRLRFAGHRLSPRRPDPAASAPLCGGCPGSPLRSRDSGRAKRSCSPHRELRRPAQANRALIAPGADPQAAFAFGETGGQHLLDADDLGEGRGQQLALWDPRARGSADPSAAARRRRCCASSSAAGCAGPAPGRRGPSRRSRRRRARRGKRPIGWGVGSGAAQRQRDDSTTWHSKSWTGLSTRAEATRRPMDAWRLIRVPPRERKAVVMAGF